MRRSSLVFVFAAQALWSVAACSQRSPRAHGQAGGGTEPGPAGSPDAGVAGYVRSAAPNPIPSENQLVGDPDWRDGASPSGQQLWVYASTEAAEAGDVVSVRVSTDGPMAVSAAVYRVGFYQGAGARRVWSGGPYPASTQASCPRDPVTSLVECAWSDTFQFTVGDAWVSGVYMVRVDRPDGVRAFYPFVVRDSRAAEILYQPGLSTYQAYNSWGGESLYFDASGTMPDGKAWKVSFDRPYVEDDGAGEFFYEDYWVIQLLEGYGYDVTYGSNLDFVRYSGYLDGIGAFVGAGHDEYWDPAEREQVDAAVAGGRTSIVYFGANGGYWRIRVEPNGRGEPARTVVCYKNNQADDPVAPGSTARYRDPPSPHPENALWGVQYESYLVTLGPLAVIDPTHWLFQGTGLAAGQRLENEVAVEFDNIQANGESPSGMSVPLDGALVSAEAMPARAQTVVRTTPTGTLVFAAGTIGWAMGLHTDPGLYDARVARMTLNALEHALAFRRPMSPLPDMTGPYPALPDPIPTWAGSVSAVAGTAGSPGWQDGAGASAQFNGPAGLLALPNGQILVADARNNVIRLIDTDRVRTVSTIAGNGAKGYRDGPGSQAMFRGPTALAFGADGGVYVADAVNGCIRELNGSGTSWIVRTYAGACWSPGFADGTAAAARFNEPVALAADGQGSLYVADMLNMRVRMIQPSGNVITVMGNGVSGQLDSSIGAQAEIGYPSALALGRSGFLYVVDSHAGQLRSVSTTPPYATSTVAGSHRDFVPFHDGNGTDVRMRPAFGLLRMPDGSLLLADTENHRIRKVVLDGGSPAAVTTWAGSGAVGQALGSASQANVCGPTGLALAADGTVLVSDAYNEVIRGITP